MHGKSCFSTVPHENHVKMEAPGLSPRHLWGTDLGCFGGPRGVVWGSFGAPKRPPGTPKWPKKGSQNNKNRTKTAQIIKIKHFWTPGVRKGYFRTQKWLPGHHFGTVWGGQNVLGVSFWFILVPLGSFWHPKWPRGGSRGVQNDHFEQKMILKGIEKAAFGLKSDPKGCLRSFGGSKMRVLVFKIIVFTIKWSPEILAFLRGF